MPKLIRVLVYEGPEDWINTTMEQSAMTKGHTWHVAGSATSEGGGGSITETFRGDEKEFLDLFGLEWELAVKEGKDS